ncbi:MAG TPA: hypothetical protein VMC80_03110, partial [Patescibacteria group bacterium]|nr:hypothetical protein [Patescibacteria group bacterium]
MGKYTAYGKNVDLEIQKQLDKICKVIISYVHPLSILLIGGFGRGEGSVIYKKNKFIPINDYDIYVITDKKYPNEIIEKMCREASESIGKRCIDFQDYSKDMEYSIENTFYPDIRVMTLQELRKIPHFLKYYEIKYSASVIYGRNVLEEIPDFDIREVPLTEGMRFLLNRISLMIMHFSPSFIESSSQQDKERVINFNSKAALSCAEALLLYSGKFVASYKKRAEILDKTYSSDFPELKKIIPKLPEVVKKYTNHKLKPDYSIKNYISDWFEIRNYSIEILKFLIFKFIGKRADNSEELAYVMNRNFSKFYIRDYIKVKFNLRSKLFLNLLSYPANFVLNLLYSRKIYDSKKRIYLKPLKHPFTPPDLKIFPS